MPLPTDSSQPVCNRMAAVLLAAFCMFAHAEEAATDSTGEAARAQEPAQDVPRPALRSRHLLELERLQQAYPEQFRRLDGDPEPAAALYLQANRAEARGWVILIPGAAEPADAAFNIERLRRTLPDSGWHTLSLQLPAPVFSALHVSPLPPAADTEAAEDKQPGTEEIPGNHDAATVGSTEPDAVAATPAEDSSDAATAGNMEPPAYSTQILALIDAAVTMATGGQPERLVILGQHEGAYWVMRWADSRDAAADALVLLHAREAEDSPALPELAGRVTLPVADFHAMQDTGSRNAARLRLDSSKRNPDSQYRLTALREPAQVLRESELVRRVKGTLSNLDAKK